VRLGRSPFGTLTPVGISISLGASGFTSVSTGLSFPCLEGNLCGDSARRPAITTPLDSGILSGSERESRIKWVYNYPHVLPACTIVHAFLDSPKRSACPCIVSRHCAGETALLLRRHRERSFRSAKADENAVEGSLLPKTHLCSLREFSRCTQQHRANPQNPPASVEKVGILRLRNWSACADHSSAQNDIAELPHL